MQACPQTDTQSVWDHGESVSSFYADVYNHLLDATLLQYEWRMPSWLMDSESRSLLLQRLMPFYMVQTYQQYHDCGKPYCLTLDEEGRRHFPDHASLSEKIWRSVSDDEQIARLIGMDMDIHLLKAEGIASFASRPEAGTLLLTGLAEIHSNAEMFGGIASTSFKAKWKHIDRRGRAILKHWAT